MSFPAPVFVGYFPVKPVPVPKGFPLPGVERICSVSHCMVEVPDEWIEKWKHNALGFFDTREIAEEVAESGGGQFDLFAYRVFPVLINDTAVEDFAVPVSPTEELTGFKLVGIDIVTRYAGHLFECSPLSCNGGAKQFPVNQYCLIDNISTALDVAIVMNKEGYEPGPYHLVEVWSERSG